MRNGLVAKPRYVMWIIAHLFAFIKLKTAESAERYSENHFIV